MKDWQDAKCRNCNKDFIKNVPAARYCSNKCYWERYKSNSKLNDAFKLYERDGFKCFYCGKSPLTDDIKLNADHLFPFSEGGNHSPNNMVTCCELCNDAKGNMVLNSDVMNRFYDVIQARNEKFTKEDYLKMERQLNNRNAHRAGIAQK